MGRVRSCATILATIVLATTAIDAQVVQGEVQPEIDPQFQHLRLDEITQGVGYGRPQVKFTLDATVQSRSGAGGSDPLVMDGPFPLGSPLLTAGELDFDGIWGGRLELIIFDPTPNPTDLRLMYMWTERAETAETRSSNPADVSFFNIVDAAPVNTYTARYQSRFALGDIGIRHQRAPGIGLSGGLAFGSVSESLDLITAFDTLTGFFSQGTNDLYGVDFNLDAQLWSNGFCRVEGGAGFGVFYNDIEINAQSQNWQTTWSDGKTAYMATGNIACVIPAYPVNFRIGYQATYVGGLGLIADQSDALRLFDGGGGIETDGAVWHGLLFGIEYLR